MAQMELNVFKLESGNYEFDDSEIKQRYDNQKQLNAQLQEQKRWLEHELEDVSNYPLCTSPTFFLFIDAVKMQTHYRRPSLFMVLLFAVMTIHIKFNWNITPVLCSKPELTICGFAIHVQIFLERNSCEYRGFDVFFLSDKNENPK